MRIVVGTILAGILAVALFAILQLTGSPGGPPLAGRDAESTTEGAPGGVLPIGGDAATSARGARRAAPGPEEAPVAAQGVGDAIPDDRLTGVVLAEGGAPIAGARVTLDYRGSGGMNILDLAYARARHAVGEARTGESGEFAFEVAPGQSMRLTASASGFGRAIAEEAFGGEHHVLELVRAAVLRGRITRAADDSPVEGVNVRVWSEKTRRTWGELWTGADGEYLFEDLPPGVVMMAVESSTLMDPEWATLEIFSEEPTIRDYALEDGIRIHGVVRDASSELPIAGAEVGVGWTFDKLVRTDQQGRYEIRGFGGWGVYDVQARARRYGTAVHEFPATAMPTEEQELDFALQPARAARGRVVNAESRPIEGVYAAAVADVYGQDGERNDWTSTSTDAEGVFELDSLDPEGWHYLYLRKRGYGSLVYHFPESEKEEPVTDFGTLVMPAGGRLSGQVVDTAGAPLPGVRVSLNGRNPDHLRFRPEGGTRADPRNVEERKTTSGQGGRFHFIDLAPASYSVRAYTHHNVTSDRVGVEVGPGLDDRDVELVLDLGLSISGRVLSPAGKGIVGLQVRTHTGHPPVSVSCTTTRGGTFSLVGLEEGLHDLLADVTFVEDTDGRFATTLFHGLRAGDSDLRLELDSASEVNGQVYARNGEPALKPFVSAYLGEHHLDFTVADEEGYFALSVPSSAQVRLVAWGTLEDGNHFGVDVDPQGGRAEVEVPAGSEGIVLRLAD